MREIRTKNGDVFVIRPMTQALLKAAAKSAGVQKLEKLEENLELSVELARLLLVSYSPAGEGDIVKDARPQTMRQRISETPGLGEFINAQAKAQADEIASGFEVDSGN